MNQVEYALYKGDELLDVGTVEELATKRGIKPESILYYSRPAYQRKAKKVRNRMVAIRLDD